MNKILEILSDGLDPAIKRLMYRRVSSLLSSLNYMKSMKSEYLMLVEEQGWKFEYFEIVFAMNSFYLLVLGPLASSARDRKGTVWENTAISYGKDLLFDKQRARKIQNAHQSFSTIAQRIPGGIDTLTGNQASDIVFKLYRAMKHDFNI